MASSALDPTTIALQLEAVTAQIRALSPLPEAQRGDVMQQAVNDLKMEIDKMKNTVQKLQSEVQSLRDTTENRLKAVEAKVYNDKMRINNKSVITTDGEMDPLRNTTTNEEIPGFPLTVRDVFRLKQSEVTSMCLALGWTFGGSGLRESRSFLLQIMGYSETIPNYL